MRTRAAGLQSRPRWAKRCKVRDGNGWYLTVLRSNASVVYLSENWMVSRYVVIVVVVVEEVCVWRRGVFGGKATTYSDDDEVQRQRQRACDVILWGVYVWRKCVCLEEEYAWKKGRNM